jgi:ParB family chromosome partitioning protein
MTPPTQRITRGFSIGDDEQGAMPEPRRVRTRQQIINGEGKRAPASVELKLLAHNPYNPREELAELEDTVASLKEKGQLVALTVVTRTVFLAAHPGKEEQIGSAKWVVLDGNRRLAAAPLAGLTELRIDVNDALAGSAADLLENALIANLHRVDLQPMDEARAVRDLVKIHGTQEKVGQRLSKSGAWVSQRLALLELPEELQEKVETGELKVKDGRRIGRLPQQQQQAEAEKALNRVKAPRKPRALNPVKTEGEDSGKANTNPPVLNPVNGSPGTGPQGDPSTQGETDVPALPWDDPVAMDRLLRQRMAPEHRAALVGLLQAE